MGVVVSVIAGLFFLFTQRGKKNVTEAEKVVSQPIVSWQKITVTEKWKKISINITIPRIIIPSNYNLKNKVNKAIVQHTDWLRDDFMSAVTTAAEDNEEANILNIETEILLMTPRFISLAFTATKDLSGINDSDPERTFLVFDLVKGEVIIERAELFRDDLAWSRAVRIIRTILLSLYQGDPNCDLSFAPKYNGFAASCIGVDWSRGGERLSIAGDIPISKIQEFLAPSVLSDITPTISSL